MVLVLVLGLLVRVLLLATDSGRHVCKICLPRTRARKQAPELLCLFASLLVRVRVLLEALDAVLQLWPPEAREQHAGVVARDEHRCRVES